MIFFIYGTDHYRCQEKLKELVDQFIKKRDQSGLNIVKFDAENLSFDQFRQEALAAPFLGEKKLVVVKNILRNKKYWEPVFEFIKSKQDKIENNLIFIDLLVAEKKAMPTGRFFEYLNSQKYRWQFDLLNNFQLKKWLQKFLAAKKIAAEPAAINELAVFVGNDLNRMVLEISKLAAYKNGREIKRSEVKELVGSKLNENIFDLVDAIGYKNKKMALKLTNEQLTSGNHPLAILNMISRQFKILLKTSGQNNKNSFGLHPYVLKKAREQGRNFNLSQLIKISRELIGLESQLKSGAKNPELLFDLFIAKIC